MYYLRTKAAAAAIQFTVDKTKLKASNDAIQEKGKKKKKAIQVRHFKRRNAVVSWLVFTK